MLGRIYTVRSKSDPRVYIGSTFNTLSRRLSGHKTNYKNYQAGKKKWLSSFTLIGLGDSYIELVTEVEVKNRDELRAIEGRHQRATPCVNIRIEKRTKAEWYADNVEAIRERKTKYYAANAGTLLEWQKTYRSANAADIKARAAERVTCACGAEHSRGGTAQHKRTKKHLNFKPQDPAATEVV